jgi:hypothetical protein
MSDQKSLFHPVLKCKILYKDPLFIQEVKLKNEGSGELEEPTKLEDPTELTEPAEPDIFDVTVVVEEPKMPKRNRKI